jgi:hypothetical protein
MGIRVESPLILSSEFQCYFSVGDSKIAYIVIAAHRYISLNEGSLVDICEQ